MSPDSVTESILWAEVVPHEVPEPPTDLVFDDGEPLETNRHRIAMNVLIRSLKHGWTERQDVFVGGNMFVYYSDKQVRNRDFKGPDFFVVLGVENNLERQGWVVWEEGGRYPDVVVELLSPSTAEVERGTKKNLYEQVFRTRDYFVFDPFAAASLEGWHLDLDQGYQALVPNEQGRLWCQSLGLWLGTWQGVVEDDLNKWLRFYDAAGNLVLLPEEAERQRAGSAIARFGRRSGLSMNSYNPLPEIKVVPLTASNQEPVSPRPRRGRPATVTTTLVDIRWLKIEEFLNSSALAPNSRKVYERELKRFLTWTELLWGEIKPRHISQYKAYLMEEVRTDKDLPLSKSSVNSAIATLKSFFGWMVQTYADLVATNPTVGVKFEKIPLPPAQSLTAEQIQQVWSVIDYLGDTKERDTALVHLLSHGLRAGEIVALNVCAFDGKLLFIADTKNNEPRLVPLKKDSRQALHQYLAWRTEQGEVLTCDRPLILSHHAVRQGQRLSYHGIYFAVEKIGELAEIPDLHPHAFRHTYATELLLQGIDPTHARRLTGHKNELAFKRYTLRSEQEAAISAYYEAIGEEPDEEDVQV